MNAQTMCNVSIALGGRINPWLEHGGIEFEILDGHRKTNNGS